MVFAAKDSAMQVLVRQPSSAGSASYSGACRMVKSGVNPASLACGGRVNMLGAHSPCHGVVGTSRTLMRWAGGAPADRSWGDSTGGGPGQAWALLRRPRDLPG